jgi:hypothetical protein
VFQKRDFPSGWWISVRRNLTTDEEGLVKEMDKMALDDCDKPVVTKRKYGKRKWETREVPIDLRSKKKPNLNDTAGAMQVCCLSNQGPQSRKFTGKESTNLGLTKSAETGNSSPSSCMTSFQDTPEQKNSHRGVGNFSGRKGPPLEKKPSYRRYLEQKNNPTCSGHGKLTIPSHGKSQSRQSKNTSTTSSLPV